MKQLILLTLALLATSAFAEEKAEYLNILTGSTSGDDSAFIGEVPEGRAASNWAVSVGYTRELVSSVAASVETSWNSSSTSARAFEMLAGPELTVLGESQNAAFVELLEGFESTSVPVADGNDSSTHFVVKAVAGKRFELFNHVSYVPEISVTRVVGESTALHVTPVSFAFLF